MRELLLILALCLLPFVRAATPNCSPVQLGRTTSMACATNPKTCSGQISLSWALNTNPAMTATCSPTSCKGPLTQAAKVSVTQSAQWVTSTLTIENVTLDGRVDVQGPWTCGTCSGVTTVCDRLQIYDLPENPNCTMTEIREPDETKASGVQIICSTTKVYPSAVCTFYKITDGGNPEKLQGEITYTTTDHLDSPHHVTSQCSLTLIASKLGYDHEHRLQGSIYPDVHGGEHLVRVIQAGSVTFKSEHINLDENFSAGIISLIVLIIIAVTVVVAIVIGLLVLQRRKRAKRREDQEEEEETRPAIDPLLSELHHTREYNNSRPVSMFPDHMTIPSTPGGNVEPIYM